MSLGISNKLLDKYLNEIKDKKTRTMVKELIEYEYDYPGHFHDMYELIISDEVE